MNWIALPCGPRAPDNAADPFPDLEVIVPLSTNTTRALAASVAIVAAGVTFAGAAAFHLPVLGFSQPARAATPAPAVQRALVHRAKPKTVKIVRTRYVTDVVHRPAPTPAYAPAPAAVVQYAAPAAAAPAATVYAPALRPQPVASPRPPVPPVYHDAADTEHDGNDDGAAPPQTPAYGQPEVGGDS